jgi:predicted nuclease of predicted toxin-antitoxin system
VKLLFDQNLSPKLFALLADLFPGSTHVQDVGLDTAADNTVWDFALHNGFAIVTKDEDYDLLGVVRGTPPKVLWLQLGNCRTGQVEAALRGRYADIEAFDQDPAARTLIIA